MAKEVKIIVASEVGNGKTTVANKIRNMFVSEGFANVDLIDIDSPVVGVDWDKRFTALANIDDMNIVIQTKAIKRPSLPVEDKTQDGEILWDGTNWPDVFNFIQSADLVSHALAPDNILTFTTPDCRDVVCVGDRIQRKDNKLTLLVSSEPEVEASIADVVGSKPVRTNAIGKVGESGMERGVQ